MKSIRLQFLLATFGLAIAFCVIVVLQVYSSTRRSMEDAMARRTDLALEFDLAIRDYVATRIRPEMQCRVSEGEFIPETMSTSFVARSVFDKVREKHPDYLLKFSSDNPRNPTNLAGPEEQEVLDYFRKNPDATEWRGRIKIDDIDYMACFKPRRAKESCLGCHGDPSDAPTSLLDRYGDAAGFHRAVDDVIAMDTVAMPMTTVTADAWASFRSELIPMLLWLVVFVSAIFLVFHWRVARPLRAITNHFASRAHGEEGEASFAPIELERSDEIGALVTGYNQLVGKFQTLHDSLEQRVTRRTEQLQAEVDERERIEDELRRSRRSLEARRSVHSL